MFNLFFRPYVPGFRVRPQDDVPGFNVTRGPDGPAQSAPPADLAGIRVGPQDDVPDFDRDESGVPRQETSWSDGMRLGSASPEYPDAAQPEALPPGVEDPVQTTPPQLPDWLYKLLTMPLPGLSTAFDPRTGQRIVPHAPLISPVRAYQTTDPNVRTTADTLAYDGGASALPDVGSVETSSPEQWPSSDMPGWPANNTGPGTATVQHADPEPTPQAAIWNTWPQPRMDGWPYAQAGGAEGQVPWPATMAPEPIGVPPTLSVAPVADSNFIPANASNAEEPQVQQRRPLPQDRPAEPKIPATPSRGELANRPPEHRTEQELSRFIEQYQRTTADLVEDLASAIARFGERFYHDSILKPGDDLARLAERFADDPVKTTLSVLNSFPQTRIEGEFLASFAAVYTILANAARGLAFERAVLDALNAARHPTMINKNTSKIGVEGLGRSVPDVLLEGITEIKSGVEINNSVQLRVQAAYAKATGVPFNLIVSPATQRISKYVEKAVAATRGTIQRFDPATGIFTPFQ